mmetsp:Transcript_142401/g.318563  ORF Transcript_142401/g.318563 Transcript_142401/m.318563 type:complete len:636 (+) Transcript_142401:20-1927(+)
MAQFLAEGRCDWLNDLVARSWPHIDKAVQKIVREEITPNLQADAAGPLKGIHFSEFELGTATPEFGTMRSYSTPTGYEMRVFLSYKSNFDIVVAVGGMKLGIKNLSLQGDLCVKIDQIMEQLPVVGGLAVYFMNPPLLSYTMEGIGSVVEIPGLRILLHNTVNKAVADALVMPNQIAVPIATPAQGVDVPALRNTPVLGLLRIQPRSATNLPAKNLHLGSRSSDPYVEVEAGDQKYTSSVVSDNCNPTWPEDEAGYVLVYAKVQAIRVTVHNHATMWTDGFLAQSKPLHVEDAMFQTSFGRGPLALYTNNIEITHYEEEPPEKEKLGELSVDFTLMQLIPKQLCGARHILQVKIGTVVFTDHDPGLACKVRVSVKVGPNGEERWTSRWGERKRPQGVNMAVRQAVVPVVQKLHKKGWAPERISKVTNMDVESIKKVVQVKTGDPTAIAMAAITDVSAAVFEVEALANIVIPFEWTLPDLHVPVVITITSTAGHSFPPQTHILTELAERPELEIPGPVRHTTPVAAEADLSVRLLGTWAQEGPERTEEAVKAEREELIARRVQKLLEEQERRASSRFGARTSGASVESLPQPERQMTIGECRTCSGSGRRGLFGPRGFGLFTRGCLDCGGEGTVIH